MERDEVRILYSVSVSVLGSGLLMITTAGVLELRREGGR